MTARRLMCTKCSLRHAAGHPRCEGPRWPLSAFLEIVKPVNLAELVGTSAETIARAHTEGLTDAMADRWAIRAGHHPSAIWDGWVAAGLTVHDERFLTNGWRPAWEWEERQRRIDDHWHDYRTATNPIDQGRALVDLAITLDQENAA